MSDLVRDLRGICGHDSRSVEHCVTCEAADRLEGLKPLYTTPPAAQVERIVLWSRGVEPNYWFIAERSKRPNINGMPVYETLDPITNVPIAAKAEGEGGEVGNG